MTDRKDKIKENKVDLLIEERKAKLLAIYKEMLNYKHKPYDEKWTFRQFTDKVSQYYNFYYDELRWIYEALQYGCVTYDIDEGPIDISKKSIIRMMDDFYQELTDKEYGYQYYAYFYRDFELQEGQTYSDLYRLEEEKFVKLFKEILEFLNVSYDEKQADFDDLRYLVADHYLYYKEILYFYIGTHDLNESCISILNRMENIYENLKNNYKNYEENMKKYEEQQKVSDWDPEDEKLYELEEE